MTVKQRILRNRAIEELNMAIASIDLAARKCREAGGNKTAEALEEEAKEISRLKASIEVWT